METAETAVVLTGHKKRRHRGFKRILKDFICHKFCLVCGNDKDNKLTVDHIVPRSLGGAKYAPENIMFLCKRCNSVKSDKDPAVWFESLCPEKLNNFCPERWQLLVDKIQKAIKFHLDSLGNSLVLS